ncbi:hypothetical protein [Methanococcus voltae]|uniref:TM2 domain-containing membrane protein YozV n=1 Tax=Methanococcus voltae TaxID=2188 RepID=A0A8J7RGT3_METVO|nr:hypothetical protein [Methanococcus voltae]MBP2172471.1 TM2 domain-containing membrane protein YozV [Methanococcus voltae]MBP2201622.1 TM2 domain-containing membrane protein YozV [Methanococcus voltae]
MAGEFKHCENCGKEIAKDAGMCPFCGFTFKKVGEKNQILAAVLSFFIPGVGQIYNGQIGKGIAIIAGMIISAVLMVVLVGFLTYFAIWIYAIYDAYTTADKINKGEIVIN